ncbi:DUF3299 domain-containing protein [Stenotrophomonas sp.]|uniref:DUF3299 domain-containing protein n=1 Tax=Stenotrophomonas sp. TaxID=69392 RepID=UPI0028A786E3|nr:DUF3299 domain-containing protein [Stenotrophomonas sp.]
MNRNACVLVLMVLAGCSRPGGDVPDAAAEPAAATATSDAVSTADKAAPAEGAITAWNALMPEDDAFLRPPPQIGIDRSGGMGAMAGVGGLIDDTGSGTPPGPAIDHSSPDRAQQFGSAAVVDDVDGREVDLDGYVVPLGMDDAGAVNELLFVPFYGACIHVPPPPPNQIIHVTLAKPIALGNLWDAYRLSGHLRIKRFEADIASASYDADAATLTAIGS